MACPPIFHQGAERSLKACCRLSNTFYLFLWVESTVPISIEVKEVDWQIPRGSNKNSQLFHSSVVFLHLPWNSKLSATAVRKNNSSSLSQRESIIIQDTISRSRWSKIKMTGFLIDLVWTSDRVPKGEWQALCGTLMQCACHKFHAWLTAVCHEQKLPSLKWLLLHTSLHSWL